MYGGTFNPIHKGHIAAAEYAIRALSLDKLYLIPDGTPPHKDIVDGSPDGKHRLLMTELSAGETQNTALLVTDWELTRKGKSYTVDTLKSLQKKHPKDKIYLLMGSDMFLSLQTWHQPEKIMRLCTICVFRRSGQDSMAALLAQKDRLQQEYHAKVELFSGMEPLEISSTDVREALSREEAGKTLTPGLACLSSPVYGYILRHHLYGTREDLHCLPLDKFRAVALSHLKGSRIPHVLGTEETAAALARLWGWDEEEARRAALLHDCTKRLSKKEHLEICRLYHRKLDTFEKREEKLLHAKTGAILAKELYGVSETVENAIAYHTTGKANMTLLEKIIYLADYIEPNRSFDGLEPLRELAFTDLDRAMLMAFEMSIGELSSGGVVHPNTLEARDYLKGSLL